MKKRRGKHKRGERDSTEDEVNSAKKPNMEAADCTNNNDSEVEESEVNFCETVSEQEPSLEDIKDMLSCVQATLKDIQHENRKMADELAELESSIDIQETQLNSLRESLSKATKANNAMKLELQALREKFNKWKRPGILRFEEVGAKLREKYLNATRVWFVNNTLQERVEHDQFRAISHDDNRLVYLDPSPDYCVRNDTLGSLGMLGRTCKHYDAQETRCQSFIDKCNSCKLKYKTVAYEVEEYRCNCNFHWCCYVKCKTCKRVPYITTCTENEKFTGYYWPQWSYSYQCKKYLLYAF